MSGQKSWRLSKTLARRVEMRPIENDDVKYAWAAYKQGNLKQLPIPSGLDARRFKTEFEQFVLTQAHAAWVILTFTRLGFVPVGIVLGQWGPSFMLITVIAWFPWASPRNILEGTVHFFNKLRAEMAVIGFANEEHKPLYVACCKHGIMSRIGTSHSLGERMAVFEVIRK